VTSPHLRDENLRWSPVTRDADEVLAEQLQVVGFGTPKIGRLCPRCGSSEHGRPWARAGSTDVPVSLSRAGEHMVTIVAGAGVSAVGIDVEVAGEKAEAWVTKEAIAKAVGLGIGHPGSAPSEFKGDLRLIDTPDGYVAAIALLR